MMEGCPKVLMISYDVKEPISTDFSATIRNYIQEFYHENPDSYKSELQQLHHLHVSIANVTRDNQGCSVFRKYFAQLQFLQSRFPMSFGGAAAMPFTWYDVYTGDPVTQKDIRYEQACVLFNLGGLYSQLGANESRSSDESMKVACTYFQCAAGAFQYLRENFSFTACPDLGSDILKLKSTIMLSQAQECLLEKSIRDNRKNTLIARISMQIKDYYQEAVKLLDDNGTSQMGSTLRKSWTKHLQMKINMYSAIAYIYMSNEADSDQKFGEKVTYLKAAADRINDALKFSKNQHEQVLETLTFLRDVAGTKFEAASKENDFVYHAMVPDLDKLPEIKGVSLVKAVPFQYNDPSISGPDIFQRLIPMRAHEASSLYSEEKASLLRKIKAEIEEKDLLLSESLTSMHIDDLINPADESLPENLVQKCKELRESDGIVATTAAQIKDLAILSEEFESIFADLSTKLKSIEEYERDAKVGEGEGGISAELESLKNEFMQCYDANEKACSTNVTLCQHFEENKDIVEFLQGPDDQILASLPSQNFIDAPSDEPVVQRIRELLDAVERMKTQRKDLEKQLRDELNKDDVTSLLVIKEDGNQEEFFKNQLAKHDEKVSIIRQNLTAQDNILLQLTEANAKYARTRVAALEVANKRETKIQAYLGHASLFLEIKDRLGHGLSFYNDLKDTLQKLEKKVNDFHQKRSKEKIEFLEKKAKDTPPPRPTAAKPTFDRASKPKGTRPATSLQPDIQFIPHSQPFQVVPPHGIPTERPNLPATPPIGQVQSIPPGPRMMAPSSTVHSKFSPHTPQGPQQNQIPASILQPHQLPQQQQPQQQPQQQQQIEYHPQQAQHPNQQQNLSISGEMPNRFIAPGGLQTRFHTAPQGGELHPHMFTTSSSTPITNRFSTPAQLPSQPISTFQAVSNISMPVHQNLRPQFPQQGAQPRMMQEKPQGPLHGQHHGPPLGQQQGPPLGQQQGPPLGQQQRPLLGQQQGPLQGQQQGPPLGQQLGPPLGQQPRPFQGHQQRPPLGQQQGPPIRHQQGTLQGQQQGLPLGQQQGPPIGQQQGVLQVQQGSPLGQQQGTLQGLQGPPLGQQQGTLQAQQGPPLGKQQGILQGKQQGPSLGQQGALHGQQGAPPGQPQGTLQGQQQGLPLGQLQGSLQGQQQGPSLGQQQVPLQGQQQGSLQQQQQGLLHGPQQGMHHMPPQVSQQGGSIHPHLPGHRIPLSGPPNSLAGNLPSREPGQIMGINAPIKNQARFQMDQTPQQFIPYEQNIIQQPHILSQQNIRNPYPQQPRFSGPGSLPISGMDPGALSNQGNLQQHTDMASMTQQELRPQFQPMQHTSQWRGQQPQRQRLPSPNQFRPQTPIQNSRQDLRFAQEIPNQVEGPVAKFSQLTGQHTATNMERRSSGQDSITHPQGLQGSFIQDQRSSQSQPTMQQTYPGMQLQYQSGLRLPEPLMPERVIPQSLLDISNTEVKDKPLDLLPTPIKCEAESSIVSSSIPGKPIPIQNPEQMGLNVSGIGVLLQRRDSQDQVQNPGISNYEHQPGSNQAMPFSPQRQVQGTSFRPNDGDSFSNEMYKKEDSMNDPQVAQYHTDILGKPMMTNVENVDSQVTNFNVAAPTRNQYAFEGPMSSPAPDTSTSRRMEAGAISLPPNNLSLPQPVNEMPPLQSNHSPTAPPITMYSQPPPFSPNRPLDLITMNNRPVMATAHSTDPIVSGILGVDRVSQQKDIMQMGFQQFQIQQMVLQQQQLISMIQNQQSQQKAAESSHVEQLQKQMLEQQKLIERLADEQHRMLEQQQQTAQVSQNQNQEIVRIQMEYQHKYQELWEQQFKLQSQRAASGGLEGTNQYLRITDQLHGLEKTVVDPPSKLSDTDKTVNRVSLVPNASNLLNRPESDVDSASRSIGKECREVEHKENAETPECFTSKAKLVASSIMSAFDLSPHMGVNQDTSKHVDHASTNEPREGSVHDISTSSAMGENLQTVFSNHDQHFKFDLDQFEKEMQAVLSGNQANVLKTPTKKETDIGGPDTDAQQATVDLLSSNSMNSQLLSNDDKEIANDSKNDSSVTLETSPPFYEPMLDIEQRLKNVGLTNNPISEQEVKNVKTENIVDESSTVKDCPSENIEKSITPSKRSSGLEGADIVDVTIHDHPDSELKSEGITGPSKLPDYPSIVRDSACDTLDSQRDQEMTTRGIDSLSDIDLDAALPNVPPCISPIPKISTPDEETDESPLASPSRPQLNRQEGRLSFYQAAEAEVEQRAYLEDLDAAVDQMHQQCMDYCKKVPGMTMDGFTRLWNDLAQVEDLDSCSFSADAGKDNPNKNRYRDILPWDHTRVRLQTLSNDYINANHIVNLTPCSPKYIATQGPIPQSFVDFWTMVWEQNCVLIVMLTNEVEGTKLKCHPYWPRKLEQTTEYGELLVCLTEQEAGPSWKCRTFLITHIETKETRTVKQLQFISWPDYGIPNTPYDLLAFNDEVRNCHSQLDPKLLSPLLLHCSAGVGRTGTFACVYSASEEIMGGNGLVEIPGLIRKLRQCRFHMVQRKEQLIFCYQAILCYAQQFLAEEQMKQEGKLDSTNDTTEDLSKSCSDETLHISEQLSHNEIAIVPSSKKDIVDTTISCNHSEEVNETEQRQDSNFAEDGKMNSMEDNVDANIVSSVHDKSDITDEPVATTSSNLLHLELDHDGPLDEKHTGMERGDNIPKFKVKSDIFASKSPPVSPGFSPLMHDDKTQ